MGIKNTLRKLRRERGLTQEQLAKAIGLSKSAIIQYENGYRNPNFEALSKLEKFFRVDSQYLLGTSEQNHYDVTNEMLNNIDPIKHIENFKAYISNLPQDEQIETISAFITFVDIIKNKNVSNENYWEYISSIWSVLRNIEKVIQAHIESNTNPDILSLNILEKEKRELFSSIDRMLKNVK